MSSVDPDHCLGTSGALDGSWLHQEFLGVTAYLQTGNSAISSYKVGNWR